MENINFERRKVFFHNLILLGTNSIHFEKRYNVSFHKDMFVTPNKKGFEAVTHFLFSRLSVVTSKDYRLPWPLIDKESGRMFQKTCYAHLTAFAQESILRFPRITPSSLSTFGGERFYEIYLAFSTYVLIKKMKNAGHNVLATPFLSKNNYSAIENVLQVSSISHIESLKKNQYITHANQLICMKFVRNLSQYLDDLKKLLLFCRELKERDSNAIRFLLNIPPTEKTDYKKITRKAFEFHKADMRQNLEEFYSKEKVLWQYMDSEIGCGKESQILDEQNFKLNLLRSDSGSLCAAMDKVGSIEVDGKFSVLRCMKLLQVHLQFLIEILLTGELSKLHETCYLKSDLDIQNSLQYCTKLLEKLSEIEIPCTKRNIETLKLECNFDSNCNTNCLAQMNVQNFDIEALKGRLVSFEAGELSLFL